MKNYADFYANISKLYRTNPVPLRLVNQLITGLMYVIYPFFLGYRFLTLGIQAGLTYLIFPGLGFLLVTLFRKLYNQPRPYEKWDIDPLIARDSLGQSMPSRHVFSATVISMCLLTMNVWFGLFLLVLSAVLAYCRVLGGVHYPKDVIVGYLLAVLWMLILI